jgi:hypothetical protein
MIVPGDIDILYDTCQLVNSKTVTLEMNWK